MKKFLKIIGSLLALLLIILAGYVIYLFADYDRLPDDIAVTPTQNVSSSLPTKTELRALTFNIGYGSYTADYTFFMDGGKSSRAKDQKTVQANLEGVAETTEELAPTIAFYQEVDQDGDRSRHVDEVAFLQNRFSDYSNTYGQNYDSSYLFYPFTEPIGQAKSGLVTLAQAEISQARRYALPIETNFNKFFDLDRAFVVNRIPTENGKELIAINLHLSAYTKDPAIQEAQISKLFSVMQKEYDQGNYVIVAGDFNHDLLGNSPEVFGNQEERYSWDQSFPEDELPENFSLPKGTIVADKIPSMRNLDIPYDPEKSYVSVIDGFLVSDNIDVKTVQVHDKGFKNSDHNPVTLDFQLIP